MQLIREDQPQRRKARKEIINNKLTAESQRALRIKTIYISTLLFSSASSVSLR